MGLDDIVQKLMNELDTEHQDQRIDPDEFIRGISKLLDIVKGDKVSHHTADTLKHIEKYNEVGWLALARVKFTVWCLWVISSGGYKVLIYMCRKQKPNIFCWVISVKSREKKLKIQKHS